MSFIRNFKSQFKLKYHINTIAIFVFLIAMIICNQVGILNRSYAGLLVRIGYSAILAVSLNLVVGFLGELSLGHAGFMCVGAYLGCFFADILQKTVSAQWIVLVLSVLIGGAVAALFGFLIGLPALRLKGDYLAIVTLAFGEIVRNIFKNVPLFGAEKGLITDAIQMDAKKLFVVCFIVLLLVVVFSQNLIRSKHGRAITAIRDNEIAARAMGINVTYYKLFVFTISAFFAGVAGVLFGYCTNPITYGTFSYNYSIEILVMVVLGGMSNIRGSIISAALITFVNFKLQSMLTGKLAALKLLIYAAILVVVVLLNNAPALKPFKEQIGIGAVRRRAAMRRNKPEVIHDDDALWNRIDTKIEMNEVLSVDVNISDDNADREDK